MEHTHNSEESIILPPPVEQIPPPPVESALGCPAEPPCSCGGKCGGRKSLCLWGGITAAVLGLILILVLSFGGKGVRVESDEDVVAWVQESQARVQAAGNTWLHEKLVRQTDNMTQELSGMESITHRSGVYRAACSFDEVAIVRYLVEVKGMKMTADCLEEAAEASAYRVCRYIIEGKLLPANELHEALSDALYEAVECDARLAEYLLDCGAVIPADKAARRLARLCGRDSGRRHDVYSRNQGRGVGPQTDEEMCNELKACARVLVERLRVPVTQQYVERATQRGLPELAEYLTSHM